MPDQIPPSDEPSDRRTEPGLRFEPEHLRLCLGSHTASVPPGASNRDVLAAYVELAARSRGDRVADLVEVRHADVEALARALDLEAGDLATQIQDVLGANRAEAARLVARLRESRVIGGIARAATSAAVAGTIVAGCAVGPNPTATSTPSSAPATTAAPAAPASSDEVVLIEPLSQDAPQEPGADS